MPQRLMILLALVVSACTSYADPATIRAPQSSTEKARYDAASRRVTDVMNTLALRNQDICALPCRLDVYLGIANGVGAFADKTHVWLPVPMVEEAANADELALIIGHEWAHVVFDGGGAGFDAARELRAECLGAMFSKRAGYDPVNGAQMHYRFWGRENGEKLLLLALGVFGGGTSLPWPDRIDMVKRAAATDASKGAMAKVCGVRW